jgi:hypothetical protein
MKAKVGLMFIGCMSKPKMKEVWTFYVIIVLPISKGGWLNIVYDTIADHGLHGVLRTLAVEHKH